MVFSIADLVALAAAAVALPRLSVSRTVHAVRVGAVLVVQTTIARWCVADERWCLPLTALTVRAQSRAVGVGVTLVERLRCNGWDDGRATTLLVAAHGPLVVLAAGGSVLDVWI